MKKNLLNALFIAGLISFSSNLLAQHEKCSTMKVLEQRMKNDPTLQMRMEQSEITTQKWIRDHQATRNSRTITTIPVVVHVIYHDSVENISDAQIQSQIDVLNLDFRLLNSDSLPASHPFWPYSADSQIEFCLAGSDPGGNPTTGIIRTYTDSTQFSGNGTEKYTATGGDDNWDPTMYLNLWVCNLNGTNGTLGYAAFPADLATAPGDDGVVIRYEAFGTGTAAPNDLGRTATHEVGHWLNLRHIWGDNQPNCGDDFVSDTPPAYQANYNCPSFPWNPNDSCGTDVNGEMYMNYMDYVDDACMNMFTFGQVARMQAALNNERIGILTSTGCGSIGVNEIALNNKIEIYPNPNNGNFTINAHDLKSENTGISVYNVIGELIQKSEINKFPFVLHLNDLSNGVYYLKISNDNKMVTKKILISR